MNTFDLVKELLAKRTPHDDLVGRGKVTMSRLHQLSTLGQSVWIDFLSRDLIESGALGRAIADDGVVGVTSNPTIFEKALAHGNAYDAQLAARGGGDIKRVFHALAMRDVATACDVLRPVWERTRGGDGYVSIEVDPDLAHDTQATTKQAQLFHDAIAKPNLLVKIPATDAGVDAIEEMTARGRSINVTLIFSLSRHRQVIEAYLAGLERLIDAGGDAGRVHSVASFFVSRVDTETDRRLDELDRTDSKADSGSPTPNSPTSNTRRPSQTSAGRNWPRAAPPSSAASGPRPQSRIRTCATRSTSKS